MGTAGGDCESVGGGAPEAGGAEVPFARDAGRRAVLRVSLFAGVTPARAGRDEAEVRGSPGNLVAMRQPRTSHDRRVRVVSIQPGREHDRIVPCLRPLVLQPPAEAATAAPAGACCAAGRGMSSRPPFCSRPAAKRTCPAIAHPLRVSFGAGDGGSCLGWLRLLRPWRLSSCLLRLNPRVALANHFESRSLPIGRRWLRCCGGRRLDAGPDHGQPTKPAVHLWSAVGQRHAKRSAAGHVRRQARHRRAEM